ncbi:MAG: HEAT repeat domain-containing protein [Elusimicrobia bacterium]|nr:HEAT repeat domain-containing protein [Elusimicrobiota bacterium]
MKWILMVTIFILGVWYLVNKNHEPVAPAVSQNPTQQQILSGPQPALRLTPETQETLKKISKDPEPKVRWAAMEIIYRLKDPQAILTIHQALPNETDPWVRKNIYQMFAESKDRNAMPLLLKGLKDYDKEVRIAAINAIGALEDPSVVPLLNEVLKDFDPDIKLETIKTIDNLRKIAEKQQHEIAEREKNILQRVADSTSK